MTTLTTQNEIKKNKNALVQNLLLQWYIVHSRVTQLGEKQPQCQGCKAPFTVTSVWNVAISRR